MDAPDALGSHTVGYVSFQAVDPAREDRTMRVDVWYPAEPDDGSARPARYALAPLIYLVSDVALEQPPIEAGSTHPLLVFSHGYGAINTQSVELMEALASHGFIVASPEHTGNAQPTGLTDTFDEAAANRVPDVSFVIDRMLARGNDPTDLFAGGLDEARIGVIGHSFGGMTAIGMAAGWAGAPPDPRVRAIVPISAVVDASAQSEPRDSPNAGFTPEALASISVPVMLIGGTADIDVLPVNNELAFAQMTGAPVVYKVDVLGATHTHFANICTLGNLLLALGITQETWPSLGAEELVPLYETTCGPDALPIEEASRLLNLYSVAFFRRHLFGEARYERFLTEAYAAGEPNAELSVRR